MTTALQPLYLPDWMILNVGHKKQWESNYGKLSLYGLPFNSLHLLVNSLHKMDISLRRTLGAGPVKMSDLGDLTVLNIIFS